MAPGLRCVISCDRQYSDRHSGSVRAIIGIGTVELNLPGGSTLVLHNLTKPASVSGSHQEGGPSTEGTSCLLEDRRYTPCTLYVSHSERVTYFWWISLCHRYGTDDLDTLARPASRIYPKPAISQNFPFQIISFASIASTANR